MTIDELFDQIQNRQISRQEAKAKLSLEYLETASNYILDPNRDIRTGIPEIIYAEYKTYDQVIELSEKMLEKEPLVIVSRFPDNEKLKQYFEKKYPVFIEDKVFVVGKLPKTLAKVLIISGGSADHAVAAEVALTLKALGIEPLLFEDRGLAHPTRVIDAIKQGTQAQIKVAVVIAGMEAALATFVSSMLPVPIIGVPTSVGYGYKAGETALIAMLSACTPNLAVVNIDGGLRAAVLANLIAKMSN